MIISAIAVPAFAGATGLTYQAGWEASDLPHNLVARATLSFSGGNGREVYCSAVAETNLGNLSIIFELTHAISASYMGEYVPYQLDIPFVVSYYGSATYTGRP